MKHIALAGNIAAGKTTLAGLLADELDGRAFLEESTKNPYLEDFYRDMKTWGFHSQLHFLIASVRQQILIEQHLFDGEFAIQDRSRYENFEIFTTNLFRTKIMSQRDFKTIYRFYKTINEILKPPDLILYLKSPVLFLLERIQLRGRDCEKEITIDYLTQLNEIYEEWIDNFELCQVIIIPVASRDFINSSGDLKRLVSLVRKVLDVD